MHLTYNYIIIIIIIIYNVLTFMNKTTKIKKLACELTNV
jgi:hypothetical protein